MELALLVISFLALLAFGVPVSFALGLSCVLTYCYEGLPIATAMQSMVSGINAFSFLAVPFFILSGELMLHGGIADRILRFAQNSVGHFREYLQAGAASVVQVDVARIGGITPWLKVAHLAEAFNVPVAPHFLMELHVSLCCAVPNALCLEHIPQLRAITATELAVRDGRALAPQAPGLGIDWDLDAIDDRRVA